MNLLKKDIIFNDVNKLKGVGKQLSKYLKNKKIEKVKDILLNLPYSETDRSKITSLDKLEIGKIQTIRVKIKKLNFPRVRNLPNKISCENDSGKIEIVYFNSREGYLRKIYPVDKWVVISGKIGFFNKLLTFCFSFKKRLAKTSFICSIPTISSKLSFLTGTLL